MVSSRASLFYQVGQVLAEPAPPVWGGVETTMPSGRQVLIVQLPSGRVQSKARGTAGSASRP